ncbi:MAG: hypothetical protein P4L99_08295 [Chthoniobacter sp.]|nr:hypothetical protein [Chthoniobacter sp.]
MPKQALLIFLILVCLAGAAKAADLPTLKPKTGTPVVPELMGGCSMKCAFPWTVDSVPSTGGKPVKVTVLNDEKPSPAWTDPVGIGAKLTFHFPKKIPAEMDGEVPFYGLDVINGDWSTEEAWKTAARVKRVRVYYNGKPIFYVLFSDTRRWQHLSFDDIMVRSGDSMTLEIMEIYPGAKGAPTAISEIVLQGAH